MEAELLRIGAEGVVPMHWDLSKADDGTGTVTGWASVFGNIDQQDDIVVPGAFKRSLQKWRASKRVIPFTLDHENGVRGTIGSLVSAEETPYGLRATFKFASTKEAQDARTLVKEKHVNGLSIFGGIVDKSVEMVDGRPIRILREVALMFVGLTPSPANEKALITSVKAGQVKALESAMNVDELPDLWVADMRAALTITTKSVQKTAVVGLIADLQTSTMDVTDEPEDNKQDDTEKQEVVPDADEAAKFALSVIGQSGPGSGPPGGDSADPLADLLAQVEVSSTSDELDRLAAEIERS